ncbi:MAG: YraN family protein [Candidatus Omnitrophica bacterium]|nr:YraN family protein [Candidatus Omnitrophota bacterium]
MSSDPRKILGREGEELAAQFLEENGYRLVARNFSNRYGEIDLIAEKKKELHFIEVKTRRDARFIQPEEVVDWRKQAKIRKAAQAFLANPRSSGFQNYDIYLDVISIVWSTDNIKPQIKHLVGAF